MSSTSTKDTASIHTTRQLLDELDALMERMLALPVEDGAAEGETAGAPALGATLTMLESAELAGENGVVPSVTNSADVHDHDFPSAPKPADETPPASMYSEAVDPGTSERPPEFAHAAPLDPEAFASLPSYTTAPSDAECERLPSVVEVLAPTPQRHEPLPPRLQPHPALGYQFLVWVNRGYDRGTVLFGRRGRWFRTGFFRFALGVVGLGLGAAALGWLIWDWFGWTR